VHGGIVDEAPEVVNTLEVGSAESGLKIEENGTAGIRRPISGVPCRQSFCGELSGFSLVPINSYGVTQPDGSSGYDMKLARTLNNDKRDCVHVSNSWNGRFENRHAVADLLRDSYGLLAQALGTSSINFSNTIPALPPRGPEQTSPQIGPSRPVGAPA
jgi:hypothetical protein